MTEELSRTSALASRHTALGSGLEGWNCMGTAWTYDTDPNDEHNAVRERAGMFDMSPLKKVFVRGPDAQAVLDHLTTRDLSKITPGKSAYLCVLTEEGGIADDAIVSNNDDNEWMIVHGSGDTMTLLKTSAAGRDVQVEFTDDLHDLSVQGPASLDILNANVDIDLANLGYFEHAPGVLFGHPCRISRTGYSGERGYEIFADGSVITDIWDKLVEAGVMPCSFAALDKVRIEAGLLFYGYDMTEENSPWEVGLGFTVSRTKGDFRGKSMVMTSKGAEKVNNVCLDIDHSDMVEGGETMSLNGEEVGVINSPCFSHRLGKSLALAHVQPGIATGTTLKVSGNGFATNAIIVTSPIYDPEKARTHS
ncbi:aminomethyl transferase family protein [Rhodobacteraceae bacterium B1Z28]|uniref:Aminomethyl transferase family protein n=1 Tax=Ruegeria haliotis TaxID=2747601 RepID=A0ABX2PVC9_9RHOB|nr:aminomethyltransferase family protein [Ruegeria haliotis]NVO58091.1 aminomethyl transferase family protein [Ruegeria haliotis]